MAAKKHPFKYLQKCFGNISSIKSRENEETISNQFYDVN